MQTNNLTVYQYPNLHIKVEAELQSLALRIFDIDNTTMIGVCVIEAAGIGQATIKLLFIDTQHRHKAAQITQAIGLTINQIGFNERLYQRKKANGFHTIIKKLTPDLKRFTRGQRG